MTRFADHFRYSKWDGSQAVGVELTADDIIAAIGDDLLNHGDLRAAMRSLMRRGISGEAPMQGVHDLLRELRQSQRANMERYNLSGIMDGIREQLDEVVRLERDALHEMTERPTDDDDRGASGAASTSTDPLDTQPPSASLPASDNNSASSPDDFASSLMKNIAGRNREFLDELPSDAPGQVKALQGYEFVSPEAQRTFEQLLDQLRQAMTKSFFDDVEKMVEQMSAGDVERMKRMMDALNDMLVKQIAGEDPQFDAFMDEFADMFGPDAPESLDALIEQMQRQMAAMQSLMMSLPTEQFEQLQQLLQDKLGDAELDSKLRGLAQKLDFLDPHSSGRYRFSGSEEIDLQAAMELMETMHDLEQLERQLQGVSRDGDLDKVDADKLAALLGEEARDSLEKMKELEEILEQAGYVKRDGDQFDLTPRGTRMIARSALGEIYRSIKKNALGQHRLPEEGRFGDRLDETKPYEFGDAFDVHLSRSLQNALRRNGLGTPVRFEAEDFEVYRHEQVTRTATVLLVDLSWSMELRDAFTSAKKVALALNNLITSAYPRDSFHVVGFSAYARELKPNDLTYIQTDEHTLGTNIQHALMVAEKLLDKHPGGSKQILMITDGEPTAHIEHGRAQFAYPPTPRTIAETLRAVKRCTKKQITINTFMLDESHYLKTFMEEVSRINGGRVFYSSPDRLGQYVLVDFVENKRKTLGRRSS